MTHPRMLTLLGTAAACALTLALGASPALSQQKGKLSPAKVKQIKKTRKSFEACRKEALASLKQGTITKKKFEIALAGCQESFPGASLYVNCKKTAVKQAVAKGDEAVKECKDLLVAASFDAKNPLPFFVKDDQLFFAGIGLNRPMPVTGLKPPNFDCDKLADVVKNPAEAQYFLFGNHPRMFAGLTDKKGPGLLQALKLKKPSDKGVDVHGLGRVYGDPSGVGGVLFFPSSSCDFDAEPGDLFAGLGAYYLIDAAGGGVTPYFGIAYYKQEQDKVTTQKLVAAMIKALGPGFKPFKKNAQTTFIAAAPVSETDDDQDPKNLCKQPRQHRFVAVVQGRKEAPSEPEFAVLANVKNLCDFGDRLAKKLVE